LAAGLGGHWLVAGRAGLLGEQAGKTAAQFLGLGVKAAGRRWPGRGRRRWGVGLLQGSPQLLHFVIGGRHYLDPVPAFAVQGTEQGGAVLAVVRFSLDGPGGQDDGIRPQFFFDHGQGGLGVLCYETSDLHGWRRCLWFVLSVKVTEWQSVKVTEWQSGKGAEW